jgi:hypothetical protein
MAVIIPKIDMDFVSPGGVAGNRMPDSKAMKSKTAIFA